MTRAALFLICSALSAPAGAAEGLARFPIETSPLALRGDVRPRQYLGVLGRRAAWLGWETGPAELWVHPLKLARDFQLSFRIPEYAEPIAGADLARTVEVRPELTTITYSHATFTVKEHVLAPLDKAGLLVLLEIDAARPLQIEVGFKSALQYAWPGGLGGQYVYWDEDLRAFVLSESLKRHNALIGSPWAASATAHPAHALPDAPSRFVIPVDPARARRELVPIAIAAGIAPREEVVALYRELIAQAPQLYRERRAQVAAVLADAAALTTPDPRLNLALTWATLDLEDQRVCNPDLGCGAVAGWGPAGESGRPGFGWFFGGDAAINSLALSSLGRFEPVAEGLRFFAKYQRADGKIPHEISQAAGRLPWFSEFPYTYYHADTTPFWLLALGRYWRASGDRATLEALWPAARKAWDWCRATDTDGDGLLENTTGGLGAIEVGDIGKEIHQDVYLAAVSVAASREMQGLARAMGESALAVQAEHAATRGAATLDSAYWIEAAGHHAFALLRSGRVNDTLTVWPATAAAFGLLDAGNARRTLAQLSGAALTSDWGARMLTTASPLYDPTHYNMGAVWPFVTGFLAWGHYQYNRPWAAYPLVDALAHMGFDWARGRHPELFSGAFYRPLDEAVPQQFFATSMLLTPTFSGLLGWEPDAPAGRARLAPQLPPQWDQVKVSGLRAGATRLEAVLDQAPGRLLATLRGRGPHLRLAFVVSLPPGANAPRVEVAGRQVQPRLTRDPQGDRAEVEVPVGEAEATIRVGWSGGLALDPPLSPLDPGQASSGLRVLGFAATAFGWELTAEGLSGRSYEVALRGHPPGRVEGAEVIERLGTRTRLRLHVPEAGTATAVAHVRLTP